MPWFMPPHLTHWGRATHICVGKLTIIGSDNGLSPGWRQAIIWTIAGILLIGPLGTNFSEILIGIQTFWLKKMHLKMSSAKWCPSRLGLNALKTNVSFDKLHWSLITWNPSPTPSRPTPSPDKTKSEYNFKYCLVNLFVLCNTATGFYK